MATAYHVTTPKKLNRYRVTGGILPPVRYWLTLEAALHWMRRCGRSVIVTFERVEPEWRLPLKRPAAWTDRIVRDFDVLEISLNPPD